MVVQTAVNWSDEMVGSMAICWAEKMVMTRVDSRADWTNVGLAG